MISGADGWVGIETYGQAKQEWLASFLSLPNGIPSHDTFARVFARLEPSEFEKCFTNWINAITTVVRVLMDGLKFATITVFLYQL